MDGPASLVDDSMRVIVVRADYRRTGASSLVRSDETHRKPLL